MRGMRRVFGVVLSLGLLGSGAWAQTAAAPVTTTAAAQGSAPAAAPVSVKPAGDLVEHTFFLQNVSQTNEVNEVLTAIRNMLDANVRIYLVNSQNVILMRGPAEQVAMAKKLLGDLDRPKKTYRLTYTITDSEEGKKLGSQRFSLVVLSGGRTTMKNGSKVPVVTGSYTAGTGSQSQNTYLDVGLNIDASLDESENGMRLRTKVERSSVADEKPGSGTPVIRQTVLEGTSTLVAGKPVVLGSMDIPGSTRHLDMEVVMEVAK